SLTRDELVDRFEEAFRIEAEATPNLIYKEDENFDTVIDLAVKMLDAALANWSDYYTIKGVAQAFKVDVPGLDKPLIGEYDMVVQDGRDTCISDWKTSATRWGAGKVNRDLQATVFSYAYEKQNGTIPLFRFDVITKTKNPSCESHYTSRNFHDFRRFEALANRAQYAINKGVFLPNETSFACNECPYRDRCRQWHLKNGGKIMGLMMSEGKFVGRDEIALVPTPIGTASWKPVPHMEVIDAVGAVVNSRGWQILDEQYGLARDGQRMFGFMRINKTYSPEWSRCIGIRNSHDQSIAVGLAAGLCVKMCSNLMLGGSMY
ncbi:MAG: DUF932 domain-containing protein, partial [Lentisphaeria bacterium]|nr:DUF932 domain-containing protein [Lentisphaeria bacterium]